MSTWTERALSGVLQKALGSFVKGLDDDAVLNVSLWDGTLRLQNLELNTEALAGLGLPVEVVGAYVGELRAEIPWGSIFGQPISVTLDRVYLTLGGYQNPQNTVAMEDRTLLNFQAGIDADFVRLRLFVNNVADQTYWVFVPPTADGVGVLNPPRTWGGAVEILFN